MCAMATRLHTFLVERHTEAAQAFKAAAGSKPVAYSPGGARLAPST